MKLIIQIPCYNEATSLPVTLRELPRQVPGVDAVEWLVIDDGSRDATASVAQECGVDHVVRVPVNQGLARAFVTGLDACLEHGADIIVNLDADNQYCAADIPQLIAPILAGTADFVIGERPIDEMTHFGPIKQRLQHVGSWAVRIFSHTSVQDAPSGFRAISRRAAMQLNVFSEYTYTLETIIQAGHKGIAMATVPVRVNADLRPSRLVKSVPSYIWRSGITMIRILMTYRPLSFFWTLGVASFVPGLLIGLRFVYYYLIGYGQGKVQSLILAAILLLMGGALIIVGLVADLVSVNRKLLERVDWRLRQLGDSVGVDADR